LIDNVKVLVSLTGDGICERPRRVNLLHLVPCVVDSGFTISERLFNLSSTLQTETECVEQSVGKNQSLNQSVEINLLSTSWME